MEEWQKIAILPWRDCVIAELSELSFLLTENHEFTLDDLCDRLRSLLEYIELNPTGSAIEEPTSD